MGCRRAHLPSDSKYCLCSASLCRRDFMPEDTGAAVFLWVSLAPSTAECFVTLPVFLAEYCGGHTTSFSISAGWRVGRMSGSGVRRAALCSACRGRTLLGATGGFLSVMGSDDVKCEATCCLFSSLVTSVFSSEQRRFEGDGLEEGRAVPKNKHLDCRAIKR